MARFHVINDVATGTRIEVPFTQEENDEADRNDPSLSEVKEVVITEIKTRAREILSDTDWRVIRATENGEALDKTTMAYRQTIRTLSNTYEGMVSAAATVEEVSALKFDWPSMDS